MPKTSTRPRGKRRPVLSERLGNVRVTVQGLRGKEPYLFAVVINHGGKRSQSYYRTKGEAMTAADAAKIEAGNSGARAASQLTDGDRRAVLAFHEAVAIWPNPPSLADALRTFLADHTARLASVTVDVAVAERLDTAGRRGLSVRHLADLRHRLARFSADFGSTPLRALTPKTLEAWLHGLGFAPATLTNYRRIVGSVLALAVKRGHLDNNPMLAVDKMKSPTPVPGILTPRDVVALLGAAPDSLRPALAIQAFAGLRRAEMERLDWRDVNFSEGVIDLSARHAKTGSRRLVPIRENLAAWLLPLAQTEGKIIASPDAYRRALDAARAGAKLEDWPENCLRHSFASYRLAECGDAARVAFEMGNSAAMVHRHYKALVTAKAAAAFFAIRPAGSGENVVAFGPAAVA